MALYQSLSVDDNEIRLLKLHLGVADDPLRCTLLQSCDDHHLPYEALSYEWGAEPYESPIAVNDIPWKISSNLSSALYQFRYPDRDRILWTDALCINQVDSDEKNGQIPLMTAIYQQAQRVLIWLGEEGHDSDLAFDTLNKLGGVEKQFSVTKAHSPNSLNSRQWRALEHLFTERTWWKRVWIIQEVAFARDAIVHCGSKSMHWATLHDLWRQECCQRNARLHYLLGVSAIPLDMVRGTVRNPMRAQGYEDIQSSLLCLLAKYRTWKSTKHVDKIYALFGLAGISKDLSIVPDYNKPTADVFCDVAFAIIESDCNLDVLSQVHRVEDREAGWPSWVPDWKDDGINYLTDIDGGLRPFHAGGRWTASYAQFAPDSSGRLRAGWRQTIDYARSGACDGLVRRPIPSNEFGNLTRSARPDPAARTLAIVMVDGRTELRNLDEPRSYATRLEQNKLEVRGTICDVILHVLPPIPKEEIRTEGWQYFFRRWLEVAFPSGDRPLPSYTVAGIQLFLLTLFHGQMRFLEDQIWSLLDPNFKPRCLEYYARRFLVWIAFLSEREAGPSPYPGIPEDFNRWIGPNVDGWSFCTTLNGNFGLVPPGTKTFDTVCIILGSSVPLVLRRYDGREEWEQIGTGYFHHLMGGAAADLLTDGDARPNEFILA
ncbi:HET-domain-containing protein [Hyaloscypha bicolor E]|uniref:HET-domain-containing protein n=1 Tax=Hyaloscypha bicolor E TaxID=1095630 RepID=A0A2J6SQL9_9HELO|nr:HET-domain-containing protein [Hyaloscypha bicolor E]PMD53075.1 HET-domain-containing protein [Hyaloscypha bicolor E]